MRKLVAVIALGAILFGAAPAFAGEPGQEGLKPDRPVFMVLPAGQAWDIQGQPRIV